MVGFLLWLVVPRLQGAERALILLVPLFAFLGSYGMTAMPAFASLNWEMSPASLSTSSTWRPSGCV